MSKENPTPAEKRRRTSLSKTDTDTLIGIILRKDATEKEYKQKLSNCHTTINELNKKVNELDNKIIVFNKKYKENISYNASVNSTHKTIIEQLKSKYKRVIDNLKYYKNILRYSLISNILLLIILGIIIFF